MIPTAESIELLTRENMMLMRQALLMQLDAIERMLGISPRTAELRKEMKEKNCEEKQKEPVL